MTLGRWNYMIAALHHKSRLIWYDQYLLAACHAQSGRLDLAREHLARLLDDRLHITILELLNGEPFENTADAEPLIQGLRMVGLPE